jgi:Putative Flp pilus-assembly TadE/G-like
MRILSMPSKCRNERGIAVTWLVIMLPIICGFAALAIDVAYYTQRGMQAQRAADAAALGGVVFLPNDVTGGLGEADRLLSKNGFSGSANIEEGAKANQLQVTVKEDVPSFFARVLGRKSFHLERRALAEYMQPLGMGSPSSTLGNDPESTSPQPNFWLSQFGPAARKHDGDRYGADNCVHVMGTPPLPREDNNSAVYRCNGISNTRTIGGVQNTEFEPLGYKFGVNVNQVAAGKSLEIAIFDPILANVGSRCTNTVFPDAGQLGALTTWIGDASTRYIDGSTANGLNLCPGDHIGGYWPDGYTEPVATTMQFDVYAPSGLVLTGVAPVNPVPPPTPDEIIPPMTGAVPAPCGAVSPDPYDLKITNNRLTPIRPIRVTGACDQLAAADIAPGQTVTISAGELTRWRIFDLDTDKLIEDFVIPKFVPAPPAPIPQVPGPLVPGPQVPGPLIAGPLVPGPQVPGAPVAGPPVPGPLVPGPMVPGPAPANPLDPPGPLVPGPMVPGPDVPGPDVPGPPVPGPLVAGPLVPGPPVPGPMVAGPMVPGPTPAPLPPTVPLIERVYDPPVKTNPKVPGPCPVETLQKRKLEIDNQRTDDLILQFIDDKCELTTIKTIVAGKAYKHDGFDGQRYQIRTTSSKLLDDIVLSDAESKRQYSDPTGGGVALASPVCSRQFRSFDLSAYDPAKPMSGTMYQLLNPNDGVRDDGGGTRDAVADQFAYGFRRWVVLCSIPAGSVSRGVYTIRVRTDKEEPAGGAGKNGYSIRASWVGTGGAKSDSGLTVSALERLPVYVNFGGATSSELYMTRVTPEYRGKWLRLELFDIGDTSTGTVNLTFLSPAGAAGSPWTCDISKVTADGVSPAGSGCSILGLTRDEFNGSAVRIRVDVPEDYDCDRTVATDCWVKMQMTFNGGAAPTDQTTWSAAIEGDPIRLVK